MLVILCLHLPIHSLFCSALSLAQNAEPCTWHLLGLPCLLASDCVQPSAEARELKPFISFTPFTEGGWVMSVLLTHGDICCRVPLLGFPALRARVTIPILPSEGTETRVTAGSTRVSASLSLPGFLSFTIMSVMPPYFFLKDFIYLR